MAMQMTEMALMGHIIASLVVGVLVEGGVLAGDPLAEAGVGCDVAVDPIILGGGVIDGAAVIGALDGADVGTPPAATGATVAGTILGAPMVSIAVGFMVVCSVPFPQQTPENMDWYSAQVKLGLTEFIYNSRYPHAVSLKSELVSMNTRAGSGRRVEPPQIRQAPAEALVLLHPLSVLMWWKWMKRRWLEQANDNEKMALKWNVLTRAHQLWPASQCTLLWKR